MSYISGRNLSRHYGTGNAAVSAVSDIDLSIALGEFVGIMGESGAGKSTLLSIMGAMNKPTSGRYIVDDIDVYSLSQEQRADFRREFLGFVFQSYHLMPYLTVVENVLLPLTVQKISRKEKREMAMEALENVGLADKVTRLPSQISGGEKERVAIARAIVNQPPVILADEPTGNLDTRTSREVMELLQKLNSSGATIVMVTHSRECSLYAHRLLIVSDGQIKEERINAN
jgi:putative ABC transport system ATP-binding protein